jgi:hypothetical protein
VAVPRASIDPAVTDTTGFEAQLTGDQVIAADVVGSFRDSPRSAVLGAVYGL